MKWGSAFTDLCYQHKVKLINYPVGMKPIGPPGGIAGSTLVPLKYVKAIIKQYIMFWQQEAREKKVEATREKGLQSLFDSDSEEEGKGKDLRVFEEDLVRFIPWDDGKSSMFSFPLMMLNFQQMKKSSPSKTKRMSGFFCKYHGVTRSQWSLQEF